MREERTAWKRRLELFLPDVNEDNTALNKDTRERRWDANVPHRLQILESAQHLQLILLPLASNSVPVYGCPPMVTCEIEDAEPATEPERAPLFKLITLEGLEELEEDSK